MTDFVIDIIRRSHRSADFLTEQRLVAFAHAQSEFGHRRDDLLQIAAQTPRAGDYFSGALWPVWRHRADDHYGGALWRGGGIALHRAAVDAQRMGNAAD